MDRKTLYLPVSCKVTLGGSPVKGATVTFVPEGEFLGSEFKSASGTTSQTGRGADLADEPGLADTWLPGDDHSAALAAAQGVKRGGEHRQLGAAADEDRAANAHGDPPLDPR